MPIPRLANVTARFLYRAGAETPLCLLVDVSDSFFFFLLGEGEGGVGARRGGGFDFLLKIPGGGFSGGRGAEGPGGCLRRIGDFWGGGG